MQVRHTWLTESMGDQIYNSNVTVMSPGLSIVDSFCIAAQQPDELVSGFVDVPMDAPIVVK
jgi:hypothetical protein